MTAFATPVSRPTGRVSNRYCSRRLCMKFTEGYWRMRPDVTPHFATHVYDVETSADPLTDYPPERPIHHRGDTLGIALLTVRFSSPMENVIHVQMTHHKGGKSPKPEFTLYPSPSPVQIR